jgi:hypothetical protein
MKAETAVRPCSHVPVFNQPAANQTSDSTTWNFIIFPVLTGWSNDLESCDQAVVHAQ